LTFYSQNKTHSRALLVFVALECAHKGGCLSWVFDVFLFISAEFLLIRCHHCITHLLEIDHEHENATDHEGHCYDDAQFLQGQQRLYLQAGQFFLVAKTKSPGV